MLAGGWIPHPGIGDIGPNEQVKHHAYYQWVPFVLLGQAIFFYLPHFLWRQWEGNCISPIQFKQRFDRNQTNRIYRALLPECDFRVPNWL